MSGAFLVILFTAGVSQAAYRGRTLSPFEDPEARALMVTALYKLQSVPGLSFVKGHCTHPKSATAQDESAPKIGGQESKGRTTDRGDAIFHPVINPGDALIALLQDIDESGLSVEEFIEVLPKDSLESVQDLLQRLKLMQAPQEQESRINSDQRRGISHEVVPSSSKVEPYKPVLEQTLYPEVLG